MVEAAAAAASPRRQETFYEVAGGDGGQPSPREAGPSSGAPLKLRVEESHASRAGPGRRVPGQRRALTARGTASPPAAGAARGAPRRRGGTEPRGRPSPARAENRRGKTSYFHQNKPGQNTAKPTAPRRRRARPALTGARRTEGWGFTLMQH